MKREQLETTRTYELTYFHDDIIKMETISALLAICAGNSPVPVNSTHKGQWRGALMFSLIYAWIKDCVNNREAGDLRRHRGHYDVIVMLSVQPSQKWKFLLAGDWNTRIDAVTIPYFVYLYLW